ncbi:MAG: hypothetical protein NTW60_00225 [Candidatus Wolfebacteria bacterium]|nr:hypothetical protein [Candidatus Wolfebacteria bacterium]
MIEKGDFLKKEIDAVEESGGFNLGDRVGGIEQNWIGVIKRFEIDELSGRMTAVIETPKGEIDEFVESLRKIGE